jgi:hypothetical protein
MYQVQSPTAILRGRARVRAGPRARARVSSTVLLLGLTSLLTDISSEMVSAVLPLYLVIANGYSPLAFGMIDGLYQGGAALVRVGAGFVGDRWRRHKEVATAGYGVSAACRLALLTAGSSLGAIGAIVLADRTGKGIRTAPRDALISLTTEERNLGTAFGVHRAMDTTGAMLGPLLAFAILAAAPLAFHSLFLVSLCFAVVGLMVIALFVRNPVRPVGVASAPPTLRGAAGLLRRGRFRTLLLVGGALAAVTASDNFLYLAAQRQLDVDARWFPLFFVGTAGVYMALAVPVGRLADRAGRARRVRDPDLPRARDPDAAALPGPAGRVLRRDRRRAGRDGQRAAAGGSARQRARAAYDDHERRPAARLDRVRRRLDRVRADRCARDLRLRPRRRADVRGARPEAGLR